MILGIDLGTTYSVGAFVKENGEVEIIDNAEGNSRTPSVVLFDSDNNIVVGDVAKENAIIYPDNVVAVIKNHMGDKEYHKCYNGVYYTPEMISSFIIRKMVQDAQAATGREVKGVVVTVPAYFTDAKRKATEDAATIAGVELVGMINEPTAAALCYVRKQNIADQNLLVYDLGGGTFDVTILHVENVDKIEVLATGGLSNAGGRFFDESIKDYVCKYIKEKHGIDLEDDEYVDELQEILIKAEHVKMQLSNVTKAEIPVKIGEIKEKITITREQFEDMIHTIYVRTESKVKDVMKEAQITMEDIDKVLLVGGSSRIPYIAEHIQELTGKEPSREVNPDEAVAIGAAIYAGIKRQDADVYFKDVCSHSIGVVVNDNEGNEENDIIIPRNSKLPISKKKKYKTMDNDQKILELKVTEGEYKEVTDVTIIEEFEIQLPKETSKGAEVIINISLNEYQLIHISFELPDKNFKQEYNMKRQANMDEKTVKKATGMLRSLAVS